jgi:L-amino acid N-acyltransferase YncA
VRSIEKRRLAPSMLVARIAQSNVPSMSLFQKLGFTVAKEVNIFGEIEMRFTGTDLEQNTRWGKAGTEIHYPSS